MTLKSEWNSLTRPCKCSLIVLYAAKKINYNGDGSMAPDEIFKIAKRFDFLSDEDIENIRQEVKSNENKCRELIYGKLQ